MQSPNQFYTDDDIEALQNLGQNRQDPKVSVSHSALLLLFSNTTVDQ